MEDRGAPPELETKHEESAAGEATTSKDPETPHPVQASAHKPATTPAVTPASKVSYTPEKARDDIANLIKAGKITESDVQGVKVVLNEVDSLKEKVDRLKSLLGRSAKAQRESKVELETCQKRLAQALRDVESLTSKLDKLQNRPTHLDLLMDFETNFDKALLSVGQTGGEDTAATPAVTPSQEQDSTLDSMLMQELGEAKARIEKLETLNSTMMSRATHLETTTKTLEKERDQARQAMERMQMELRMAKMEAEHATRAMQDKAASLEEMQMEIDLVTKASAKANTRAAKGEEIANSHKSDKHRIHELEAQVQALQEWALASAESKRLAQERCSILETKLKQTSGRPAEGNTGERVLFSKDGSLVVGAGDKGSAIIGLGQHASEVDARFVILRWKFDFSPSELTIDFNIMKGKCETNAQHATADYLIKDRVITGGAGGETEGAFNTDGACTLLWSNAKSWIRPRTVKYSVDVVYLK
eukprot:Nitzschia sp. Nitz4//scaffold4_size323378//6379//7881//NITZ4_000604-RA/size323378-snap-gene-0.397-mRNA-1//1//CDS//3329553231//5501//frame0